MSDTYNALTVLTEDEEMFRDMVKEFADKELRPLVMKQDQAMKLEPSVLSQLFELGLMGIEIPEEYGGAGASFFMTALGVEELARVDGSVAVMVDVQNTLVNNAVLRWATEDQKKRYCPKLATDTVGAYALSEAESGSDAFSLKCRAVEDGDSYRLTGNKLWVTNGGEAGIFIVFATVNPDAGYKGITAFIVERDLAGFTVGKKEDKLGIRASSTVEIILDDCKVPKSNILGEVGKGYKVAIETLNEGRIGIGAQMIGIAKGSLESGMQYAKERVAFGKPIAKFQGIQFQVAQCATELEAAKLLVYNACRLRDAGKPFVVEAAMAKLFSSDVAERVTSQVIEIYGGYGFVKDYPAEKYWRDSKIGKIYEGTSNMQLETIAKFMLADK
jgi:butyryl-CoA dehydrogenase/short/branched chain acyl-CoA dehydrogenase